MKAKEKAKEIITKHYEYVPSNLNSTKRIALAMIHAEITVKEILNQVKTSKIKTEFWNDVLKNLNTYE